MKLWQAIEASTTGFVFNTEKQKEYSKKGLNMFRWSEASADVWEPVIKQYIYKSLIEMLKEGITVIGLPDGFSVDCAGTRYTSPYNIGGEAVENVQHRDAEFLRIFCKEVV